MNFQYFKKRISSISISILGILAVLLVWQTVTAARLVQPFFLPSPLAVFSAIVYLFKNGGLAGDIGISIFRIAAGFLMSFAVSLPLGIAFGMSRKVESIFEPVVAFVRYVPPSAFIPLVILWFGIGEWGKILLVFLGVAPYLTILIADSVKMVRKEYIQAATLLGASSLQLVFEVVLPYSLPSIWDSSRVMVGAAWTFVIITEIVGSSSGLGHLMTESQRFLRTDNIFAGIMVIGFLGVLTDYSFRLISNIWFPWIERIHA